MKFIVEIGDSPSRGNKNHWKKTKDWRKVKDDLTKLIRQELNLTVPEANQIRITSRGCDLRTGWTVVSGETTDVVGNKIHNKTI